MGKTPSQLTRERLQKDGWLVETVERWLPYTQQRKDLWGWADFLCLRDGVVMAVQTTSYSNVSARVRKIADSDTVAEVRKAGIRIVVHGWRKVGRSWVCRDVDVS